MNQQLKKRIDEKLAYLSDVRMAEVLDFVEFLEARERLSASQGEAHESNTYLVGAEQTLNEWSSDADERAYHGL